MEGGGLPHGMVVRRASNRGGRAVSLKGGTLEGSPWVSSRGVPGRGAMKVIWRGQIEVHWTSSITGGFWKASAGEGPL